MREEEEGRVVPKSFFIKSFFAARKNVKKIKSIFGNQVEIDVVVKNSEAKIERVRIGAEKIDKYAPFKYNEEDLNCKLI
jgi:hypothetical protein